MNKKFFLGLILAVLTVLTLSAAGLAAPTAEKVIRPFEIGSTRGDRETFNFQVSETGCILAQITSWSSAQTRGTAADELALILNGSNRSGYYARQDGRASSIAPLWISYALSADDVRQVKTWSISVVNFTGKNSAQGYISLEFPPTNVPCELSALASRRPGLVNVSWRHTVPNFRGTFMVERSTDGQAWSVVSTCTRSPGRTTTNYSCTDSGLVSGGVYYYRACAVTTTARRCGSTNVTPALNVRAP